MQDDVTTQQRAVDRVRVPAPIVVALGVVAMVPMLILRLKLHGVDDPDAFWHVLSGQNVWATRQVVTTDPFGDFTTNQWIQIDWLSDLVMAAAYGAGGLAGVAWLYAVLDVVLFVALYAACRVRAGILVSAIAAFVGWFGTYASLAQRPQTISFILLAVTIGAWSRTLRRGTVKPPWWLVPLTWVWACLHGLWFLGPLIGFTVVVGLALDRRHDRSLLLRLGAVPALSVLAACLTPVGPRLLLMPITVNAYGRLVSEWQPPDIHQPNVAATIAPCRGHSRGLGSFAGTGLMGRDPAVVLGARVGPSVRADGGRGGCHRCSPGGLPPLPGGQGPQPSTAPPGGGRRLGVRPAERPARPRPCRAHRVGPTGDAHGPGTPAGRPSR